MTKETQTNKDAVNEIIANFNETLNGLQKALASLKNKNNTLNDLAGVALLVYEKYKNKTCLLNLCKDKNLFNCYFKGYFENIGLLLKYDEKQESLKIFIDESYKGLSSESFIEYAKRKVEMLQARKKASMQESLKDSKSDSFKALIESRIKALLRDIPKESEKTFKQEIAKLLKV